MDLQVHKNTRARKRRHELAKALVDEAKTLAGNKAVEGFVIIAIEDENIKTCVNSGYMSKEIFWVRVYKGLESFEQSQDEEDDNDGEAS